MRKGGIIGLFFIVLITLATGFAIADFDEITGQLFGFGCDTDADDDPYGDCNGCVERIELDLYGEDWYKGVVETDDFVEAVDAHYTCLSGSYCGNRVCQEFETVDSCPIDCTSIEFNPKLIGFVPGMGEPEGVFVKQVEGSIYAYVSSEQFGISILDVTDGNNPILVGTLGPDDIPVWGSENILVSGNRALIGGFTSTIPIYLLDTSDLTNPLMMSKLEGISLEGAAIFGDHVYTTSSNFGFTVYDVSNNIFDQIYNEPTPAQDVTISSDGRYVFVATNDQEVRVYDFIVPSNPSLINTISITGGEVNSLDLNDDGTIACVAAGSGGLQLIDVANPGSATVIKILGGINVRKVVCDNEKTVIINKVGSRDQIDLVDISNLGVELEVDGSIALNFPKEIFLYSDVLYLVRGSGLFTILDIYDISALNQPNLLKSLNPEVTAKNAMGYEGDVVISGRNLLNIFDPENPFITNQNIPGTSSIRDAVIRGGKVYLANGVLGFYILDINTLNVDFSNNVISRGIDVSPNGNYAYVAHGQYGLKIYPLFGDPSEMITVPVPPDSPNIKFNDIDLNDDGTVACVAAGSGGLQLIDVTNPGSVSIIGNFDIEGNVDKVVCENNMAILLSNQGPTVKIIDISNTADLEEIGSLNGNFDNFDLLTNYIFLAKSVFSSVSIFDISNPNNPIELFEIETPGDISSIKVSDTYAYLGDKSSTLDILKLHNVGRCGNGVIASNEECDDGCLQGEPNVCEEVDNNDGCSSICTIDIGCGDGIIQTNLEEQCDDNNLVVGDGCDSLCLVEEGYECIGEPSVCDLRCVINELPIADAGDNINSLADIITEFDGSGSYDPDGVIVDYKWIFGDQTDSGWILEPIAEHVYTEEGTYGASLKIRDDCGVESNDQIVVNINTCGNNKVDSGEQCDGDLFSNTFSGGSNLCSTYNPIYVSGNLVCDLCQIDTDDCVSENFQCGDGVKNPGEQCDALSFPSDNNLGCNNLESICNYNDQTFIYFDGYGVCNSGCECEIDLPLISGQSDELYCNSCSQHCGDSSINCGEICEPGNSRSCDGGVQFCLSNCEGWGECISEDNFCGNGVVDPGEECDCGEGWDCTPEELNNLQCGDYNFVSGSLRCNPPKHLRECKIDRSECAISGCVNNVPPIATHELEISAVVNVPIILDASGSYDSDGYITEYKWTNFGRDSFFDYEIVGDPIAIDQVIDVELSEISNYDPKIEYTYYSPGIDHINSNLIDNCGANTKSGMITITVSDLCGNDFIGDEEICEIGDTMICEGGGIQYCNSDCSGWGVCQTFDCPDEHINNNDGTCTANFIADIADGYAWKKSSLGIPWDYVRDIPLSSLKRESYRGFIDDSAEFVIENIINPNIFAGEKNFLTRYVMSFDTSSIPIGANILNSYISLTSYGEPTNTHPNSYDFLGIVSANLPFSPTTTIFDDSNSPKAFTMKYGDNLNPREVTKHRLDVSERYLEDTEYIFPLNQGGKSSINQEGWTSFGLRSGYDLLGNDNGLDVVKLKVGFKTADALEGRPVLSVTYAPDPNIAICGNGEIELGEQCDTDDLGGSSCNSLVFLGGDLRCSLNCEFDTMACFNEYPYCVGENEAILDSFNSASCCEGLELIGPKRDENIDGYCVEENQCGNDLCEVGTESYLNCPLDCLYHHNAKDYSYYSEKEAFLISDLDWRNVLPYVPVSVWTEENEVKKYPLLIYHQDNFNAVESSSFVTDDNFDQLNPDIYGTKIVWQDKRNGNWDIYMCDINLNGNAGGCSTGDVKTRVTSTAFDESEPKIYGDIIVWKTDEQIETLGTRGNLLMCDLSISEGEDGSCFFNDNKIHVTNNGIVFHVVDISSSHILWQEDVLGETVEWYACDLRLDQSQQWACSLESPKRFLNGFDDIGDLEGISWNPSLYEEDIAFSNVDKIGYCNLDIPMGQIGACYPNNWKYISDLELDGEFYDKPAIYGNSIVWIYSSKIFHYDLSSGETRILPVVLSANQLVSHGNPTEAPTFISSDLGIYGDNVIWVRGATNKEYSEYVYQYNMIDEYLSTLSINAPGSIGFSGSTPEIYDNLVVWIDSGGLYGENTNIITNLGVGENVHYSAVDVDPVIRFLDDYNPSYLDVIGGTTEEIDALLSDSSLGAGLNAANIQNVGYNDYLDYWDYYNTIIYVDNNYELALLAAAYSSLLNAPLIIEGSLHDIENTFMGKEVICIGATSPSGSNCVKRYELGELRELYKSETQTDKIILVNPGDINMNIDSNYAIYQALTPDKTSEIVHDTFTKLSMGSPILASAKHELIYSTNDNSWSSVDNLIENVAITMFEDPQLNYLTIFAGGYGVEMRGDYGAGAKEGVEVIYAELNGDSCRDVSSGRITGYTNADTSSLVARSLFLDEITEDNDALVMFFHQGEYSPEKIIEWWPPIQNKFDSWNLYLASLPGDVSYDAMQQDYLESEYMFYSYHGNFFLGLSGVMGSNDLIDGKKSLSNSIQGFRASNTHEPFEVPHLFQYENLRRGSIAWNYGHRFTDFYENGLSTGESVRKVFCQNDFGTLLLGDPTLTFKDYGLTESCEGVNGACCGNNIKEEGEDCDGPDLGGNECSDVSQLNYGYLFCSPSCTFDISYCTEYDCTQRNQKPTSVLSISAIEASVGEEISFDGTGSYDSDGVILNHKWISKLGFGGSNSGWVEDPTFAYTYEEPGVYRARHFVRDACLLASRATEVNITVSG